MGTDVALSGRDIRISHMLMSASSATKPVRGLGDFFAMSLDAFVILFRSRFAWREYILQTWFVIRVSTLPALALVIPVAVLVTYTINTILMEFGAADYSGAGASIVLVGQIGPVSEVMAISSAAVSAITADLGARNIREELAALQVMGINPIQALAVPRVLACTTVALTLFSIQTMVGLIDTFFFSTYLEHVSPGAFVDHLTLVTGVRNVIVSLVKVILFGVTAGLIACYKGFTVSGGPAGVGNAVNEAVVFSFVTLFIINTIMTAIGVQFTVS